MIFRSIRLLFFPLIFSSSLLAKINVVTTLSDLETLVEEVGGTHVHVDSICKGKKDPHFLSAKPSYIIKVSKADLVVANGLGLETGWLPKLLSAARNPKVTTGSKGYLEVGDKIKVLDIPTAPITRAQGDVHPEGNPHITLDPIRLGEIAVVIANKLAEIDSKNSAFFKKNAFFLQKRLKEKTKDWQERLKKTGIKSVVTYHETLVYFLDRFGIKKAAILEPFPGVPPTAKHTLNVIKEASEQGTKLILVEQYFDERAAKKPASQIPGVQVSSVPVAVQKPKIPSNESLIEALVQTFERHKVEDQKKITKQVIPDKKDKPVIHLKTKEQTPTRESLSIPTEKEKASFSKTESSLPSTEKR